MQPLDDYFSPDVRLPKNPKELRSPDVQVPLNFLVLMSAAIVDGL